jgi:hypothetical protein
MAQAADSPIGFRPAAKVTASGPLGDSSPAELHAWQASPAGMAAAEIFSLGSTVADLQRLAANPLGSRCLAPELPGLELIQTEITRLISEVRATREIAA